MAGEPRILFSSTISDTCGLAVRRETAKMLGFDCLINVKCDAKGKEIAQFGEENRKMGEENDNFANFPQLKKADLFLLVGVQTLKLWLCGCV